MKSWSGSAGICFNEQQELLMVRSFFGKSLSEIKTIGHAYPEDLDFLVEQLEQSSCNLVHKQ